MPKNSFLQALFSGPKFSLAPIEQNNRGTLRIGDVVPVYSRVLNPREGIELNMSHLVRFLPAKAPVMEGYKVTFDAFAVPYSALGYAERRERDIDDFFNLKVNAGNIENPFCYPMTTIQSLARYGEDQISDEVQGTLANCFRRGSLGDFLNWPSLKNVREHVRKWLAVNPLAYGANIQSYYKAADANQFDSVGLEVALFVALACFNDPAFAYDAAGSVLVDLSGRGHGVGYFSTGIPFSVVENPLISFDSDGNVDITSSLFYTDYDDYTPWFSTAYSLLGYILRNYPAVASYYGFELFDADSYEIVINRMANHIAYMMDNDNPISLDYLQVLYDNYKVDAQSIYDEYFEYIMSLVLYNPELINSGAYTLWTNGEVPGVDSFLPMLGTDDPIDLSLFSAYWKIISDWYINTNIDGDPEDFFLSHCCLLSDHEQSTKPSRFFDTKPFKRRWANDIFTSAVPMAQIQNIRIPSDGTIPDLRDANAMQKLVDILRNTGNRLRDVVFGIRGARASAVRSEMSEPIATKSTWIGMQSVLQTSETTPDSPQAAYAGIGTDSSGFDCFFKYVNNDEPTPVIIMVLMSVTQRASYMQGFDRSFFRKSIYDFAIPQLAMVGEQEVTNKEIYFDKEYRDGIFGFNRRYYDWFYSGSQVHGDLRDTMDYWHGARIFDEQPSLNPEFIGIESEKDHLQRVFANVSESAMPIIYNISFDGYATVALPRYIQYEL